MFRDSKAGDKVYTTKGDNIVEFSVEKVGRKYFYINTGHNRATRYNIADGEHNDSYYNTGKIYLTKQTIKDEIEFNMLKLKIWRWSHADVQTLSLDQLRRINSIIEEWLIDIRR